MARQAGPRDRVLLEGEMGAGKSTFARAVIEAAGVGARAEGSPTFALVHEYHGTRGPIAHLDLYRLKSEVELEEAGLLDVLWSAEALVLVEWVSNWPELEARLLDRDRGPVARHAGSRIWRVNLRFSAFENRRDLEIWRA